MDQNQSQQQRRNFLKASLTLGAAALITPSQAVANLPAQADEFAIAVGPYLQTNFGNEMTILWLTNKAATGWVAFGENANQLDQKAYGKTELGLKAANTKLNAVTLQNLSPGKTYYYRVYSKEIKDFQPYKLTYGNTVNTETESFVNSDITKPEVSFLMLNDIHDRPQSIPLLIGLDKEKNNDFVFFNGDIFDYQTDEQQIIDHMLKPCVDSFAKKTPFIYVRGNHETRGKFAREFPQYFKHVGHASFSLGPVRFVILDTGEDKEDAHPVYAGIVDFDQYRIEQAAWLKEEINSKAFKKAPFRIVMMHIPPRFSGDAHGPKHCTELFDPLLNQGKVDLVLSGHTHKYIIHQPNKAANTYPLVIGGGPKDGNRTLTKITATAKEIKVTMLDDSGKEVGNYTAKKRA
ncbi:FN3 domain-containing metallophosphoesterase family protein [Pedobacter sp. Hv1]|uniref:FN3 domain-containing metallophosphoesterase family protein n=1 Tax=Pedobacter sp. Hv1 TaxID=1740090 RepID=UPI0006D8ABCB|nr:FN3 domain-containing metallophosphoesterase family protein [Pedobacter sp. Hv1]KQB99280.1 metallophosphoesterase [Pedobacter sp. Hv1]